MLINNKITMAEVLQTTDFRDAQLIAGEGGVAREVNWVHVLETWDSANEWIDGEELILCSAVGVKDPKNLIPFFKQLLDKKISGFCLQLNMYVDTVPQEMIDLSNERNCPLIVFHRLVRFIDLSRNLIRVIIEYVNQEYILEKQRLDANYWMLDWLNGNLNHQQISSSLKIHPLELKKYHYFSIIVEYQKNKIAYQWSESIYLSVAKNLRETFEMNQFIYYPFFANGQLSGIVLDYGRNDSWKLRFKNVAATIKKNLHIQKDKPTLILACGYRSHGVKDIPRSYKTAINTLEINQNFDAKPYIYEDLNLYFILSLIKNANYLDQLKDFVMDQLKPLINYDLSHNGKLMNTLKKYYDCHGNKQLTAQQLKITRQSLYYRLEQIEDLLGIDPILSEHRLTMEMCFVFYSYFLEMKD